MEPTSYQEVQHIKPKFAVTQPKEEYEDNPIPERQTVPRYQERTTAPQLAPQKVERAVVNEGERGGAVTREEYDELVAMLSAMSSTQTELVSKFNDFQTSVVGWVNNLTAKVTILEENVKTIKQNL